MLLPASWRFVWVCALLFIFVRLCFWYALSCETTVKPTGVLCLCRSFTHSTHFFGFAFGFLERMGFFRWGWARVRSARAHAFHYAIWLAFSQIYCHHHCVRENVCSEMRQKYIHLYMLWKSERVRWICCSSTKYSTTQHSTMQCNMTKHNTHIHILLFGHADKKSPQRYIILYDSLSFATDTVETTSESMCTEMAMNELLDT